MMTKQEVLAQYSWKYDGDWSSISKALAAAEEPGHAVISDRYITIFDEAYPDSLRQLRFPPWVLYYRGDLSLLKQPAITIVGSRKMNSYGKTAAEISATILADRFVLVSGLAKGVDGIVHRTAMGKKGRTIGVIGCGLNIRYPRENEYLYKRMEKEQLIISEYPSTTGVKKHHFPWRNRILAALSQGVIVTQAAVKSGTMCTVNEALTLGREVWCFPYLFNDPEGMGCNLLISQGANILCDEKPLRDLTPLKSL